MVLSKEILADLHRYQKDLLQKANDHFIKNQRETISVGCFSESLETLLMWSHYSDKYQGICIEYHIERLPDDHEIKNALFPVAYTDRIFQGDINTDSRKIAAALHKMKGWQYEKEWRLINTEPEGLFNMIKPSHIYCGSRIRPSQQTFLQKLSGRRKIKVSKMELSTLEFAVRWKRLAKL